MFRLAAEPIVKVRLDQRDRAAVGLVGLVGLETGLPEQVARDHAVHNLQHGRHQLGLRGQQQAQRDGQPHDPNEHPLAHRYVGDDVVHQAGRRLRHATSAARGAKAAPLATEGDELVVAAVTAAKPQEAVGQDSALEEGVELGLGRSAADRPWRKHAPGPSPAAGQSAGTALRAGSAPVAASADYIETMLRAIVGIEIPLVSLTGKWGLSQNRPAAGRNGVIRGLGEQPCDGARALARQVARPGEAS